MTTTNSFAEETGLTVSDARDSAEFAARGIRHRDALQQMKGLQRLQQAVARQSDDVLVELVEAAVLLCGADSAGISLETAGLGDESFYHWVAAAGEYSPFFDAKLPRYPSACGICLERGQPQHFLVTKRFFDILGVEAASVTDGLLLPWVAGTQRGTIFIMAHGRTEAFDLQDCEVMEMLADFASTAVKHQMEGQATLANAGTTGAKSMAHLMAHRINNPLQSLTNMVFIASNDDASPEVKRLALELTPTLDRLTDEVRDLLATPYNRSA